MWNEFHRLLYIFVLGIVRAIFLEVIQPVDRTSKGAEIEREEFSATKILIFSAKI